MPRWDTCDWTGTFYTQVIGADLSRGSDTKEFWVYIAEASDQIKHSPRHRRIYYPQKCHCILLNFTECPPLVTKILEYAIFKF